MKRSTFLLLSLVTFAGSSFAADAPITSTPITRTIITRLPSVIRFPTIVVVAKREIKKPVAMPVKRLPVVLVQASRLNS